jgi:plastocyanin
VWLVGVAALAAGAAAAGAQEGGDEPPPPRDAAVSVTDFAYAPAQATVSPGGTVTWSWTGAERHSVTSDDPGLFDSHPTCADQAPFRANCGGQGTTFAWTAPSEGVTEPLTVTYRCKLHAESQGMVATIVVDPAANQPPPSPSPTTPSPTRTSSPSAAPARPSPAPQPSPAPRPSPRPSRSAPPVAGPPSPSPTAPLPTVTGDPTAPETDAPSEVELEDFVAPRDPGDPDVDGEVVVGSPRRGGGGDRTVLLAVATLAFCGTAGAFTSLVLFGPDWA